MQDNPFAPPAVAEPPVGRGLVFSAEGSAVVSSLAAWMRGLSTIYFACLGFLMLGGCASFMFGGGVAFLVTFVVMAIFGAFFGGSAMWLRAAASDFERGMLSDDEIPLGQGFRSLRAFLMLSGIVSVLTLAWQIYGGVQ
jgi:hypothetical protein